jgi:hypothetical protein
MCVGDNFVVPTHEGNNERVELYILKCQKQAIERSTCPWGVEFDVRGHVNVGLYC